MTMQRMSNIVRPLICISLTHALSVTVMVRAGALDMRVYKTYITDTT